MLASNTVGLLDVEGSSGLPVLIPFVGCSFLPQKALANGIPVTKTILISFYFRNVVLWIGF